MQQINDTKTTRFTKRQGETRVARNGNKASSSNERDKSCEDARGLDNTSTIFQGNSFQARIQASKLYIN